MLFRSLLHRVDGTSRICFYIDLWMLVPKNFAKYQICLLYTSSHPVTVRNVFCQCFTDIVQSSGEDKLVGIIHVVEVGACCQPMIGECVSGFVVEQLFSFRITVGIAIRIIISCRLFLSYGERSVDTVVGVDIPVQSDFRVEKVEFLVYGQRTQRTFIPVVFVICSVDGVVDVPVLQVGIGT